MGIFSLKVGIVLYLCSLVAFAKASSTISKGKINEQCGHEPFDIVLVLDGSGSVSPDEFSQQLHLASDLVDSIKTGQNDSRLGVVSYGDTVNDVININAMEGEDKIKTVLRSLQRIGGEPRLGDALYYLRFVALNDHNREMDTRRVAIVFSSGIPKDRTRVINEARAAQEQGITIIVVGIGNQVAKIDFAGIARSPPQSFTLIYRETNDTNKMKKEMADMICRGLSRSNKEINEEAVLHRGAKCHLQVAIDTAAGFDVSGIGISNSKLVLRFLESLVNRIQHGSMEFRLKTVTTKCSALHFDNITMGEESDIEPKSGSMYGSERCKNILILLQKLRQQLKTDAGNKKNVVILFLSSKLSKRELNIAKMQLRNLASAGVEIVIIGVGNRINEAQTRDLASPSCHYFFTPHFDQLLDLEGRVLLSLCKIEKKSKMGEKQAYFATTKTNDAFEKNLHDLSM